MKYYKTAEGALLSSNCASIETHPELTEIKKEEWESLHDAAKTEAIKNNAELNNLIAAKEKTIDN